MLSKLFLTIGLCLFISVDAATPDATIRKLEALTAETRNAQAATQNNSDADDCSCSCCLARMCCMPCLFGAEMLACPCMCVLGTCITADKGNGIKSTRLTPVNTCLHNRHPLCLEVVESSCGIGAFCCGLPFIKTFLCGTCTGAACNVISDAALDEKIAQRTRRAAGPTVSVSPAQAPGMQ